MLIKHTRKSKLTLCFLTIDYFKSDTSLSSYLNIISKFSKRQKKTLPLIWLQCIHEYKYDKIGHTTVNKLYFAPNFASNLK